MDYFNFLAEWEGYSTYFSKMIQILQNIGSFISDYNKMKDQLIKNMKISLNNLITEVKKPMNLIYKIKYESLFEKNLAKVILFVKDIILKETKENEILQNEIILPLNSFIKHINNQNVFVLNEFKVSIDEIYKQKKKCDLSKSNYINCGNQITLLSEKINNLSSNENPIEIKELSDNLNTLKLKFQKYYVDYKDNITQTNGLFIEKNKKYFSYITKLKDLEESKESFMNFFIEKIDNYLKNKVKIINKLETDINSIIPNTENKENKEKLVENKRNIIDEQLNNFVVDPEKKIRLKNEEFIEYETYKIQLSNLINQNRMYLKEDTKNNRINFNPQEILINTIEQNSLSSNTNKNKDEYIFSKEENSLIEKLFLKEETDKFKTEQLIERIKNNFEYAQNLIDKILDRYTSSIGVQFLNENNFIKYAKMVNAVLLNKEIQRNLFEINFAVIYIAEKTFYQKEENPFYKRYLCKLISESNEYIKSKDFWFKLLQIRIEITIDDEANIKTKTILKEENKKKSLEKKKNELNNKIEGKINEKKNSNKKLFGFGIPNIVGNFFGIDNNMSKEEKELEEKEKKRKKEIYDKIYKEITVEIVLRLIKDFIVHFSCFSVESYDVMDIISNTVHKYKVIGEENKIKYFIAIFNSNMYSIKNSNFRIKDMNINYESNRLSKFMNQNYLKGNANKNNKSLIILNIMKYLPFSDYKNILLINKSTYKLIIRILYSNLLINTDEDIPEEYLKNNPIPNVWKNPNIRINIWKYFLNYNKNINYKEIIDIISKKENKQESFEIIELDVKRMWFEEKTEEIRKSLNNILCALAYLHPKLGYSQGMNCIASLLYDVCESEEEAFKIYNCILESTDYGELFMNDLKRLKKYFYVFERLIFIYLPEVFLHLTSTKIAPRFFISPWFITLFTNAYKSIKGKGKPKVLIWIFDSFIIEGWGAINKIGLCLMKHFERKILIMDTDELLHFLINDIINYDFFKNSNYDRLRNIYDNLHIENGLIENIENEYEIKNNVMSNANNLINNK